MNRKRIILAAKLCALFAVLAALVVLVMFLSIERNWYEVESTFYSWSYGFFLVFAGLSAFLFIFWVYFPIGGKIAYRYILGDRQKNYLARLWLFRFLLDL